MGNNRNTQSNIDDTNILRTTPSIPRERRQILTNENLRGLEHSDNNVTKDSNLINITESNHVSIVSDPILFSRIDLPTCDSLTTTAANFEIKQLVKEINDDLKTNLEDTK